MSPRRSSFEITIDVLTVIAEGERRPTRIMYASNLSWASLRSKLDFLVNKGYVDEDYISERNKQYSITAKGLEALRYYNGIVSLIQVTPDM